MNGIPLDLSCPRDTLLSTVARISQVPLPLSNVQNIPIDFSFPSQSSSILDSTHIDPSPSSCKFSEHIQKMKMIQLSSSSLSDFITPRFNLKNSYPCTRVSLPLSRILPSSACLHCFSVSRRRTERASLSSRLFVQSDQCGSDR